MIKGKISKNTKIGQQGNHHETVKHGAHSNPEHENHVPQLTDESGKNGESDIRRKNMKNVSATLTGFLVIIVLASATNAAIIGKNKIGKGIDQKIAIGKTVKIGDKAIVDRIGKIIVDNDDGIISKDIDKFIVDKSAIAARDIGESVIDKYDVKTDKIVGDKTVYDIISDDKIIGDKTVYDTISDDEICG